jgi:hypothetical protein
VEFGVGVLSIWWAGHLNLVYATTGMVTFIYSFTVSSVTDPNRRSIRFTVMRYTAVSFLHVGYQLAVIIVYC